MAPSVVLLRVESSTTQGATEEFEDPSVVSGSSSPYERHTPIRSPSSSCCSIRQPMIIDLTSSSESESEQDQGDLVTKR